MRPLLALLYVCSLFYHHFSAGVLGGIRILGRGCMFQAYILFSFIFYFLFSWCLTIATACVVVCNDKL